MNTSDLKAEIVRHHQVIQDWLTGMTPNEPPRLAPFRDAHAADFSFIDPEGTWSDLATVVRRMTNAHGTVPQLVIDIDRVRPVRQVGELMVVTYRETHVSSLGDGARIATAVLTAAHGRLGWRHLHETWESRT